MSSTAATSVTAEAEQLPREGPRKGAATPAVATSDRLLNRERQSLAQATQLAAKLCLDNPGLIYAVKHVVTARKGTTFIIFDRGRRQQVQAAGEDGEDEDEDEDEDVAPAAAEPKPKPKGKPKPSAKPPQPASRPPPPALAGGARPTTAATPPAKQQGAGAGTEQRKLDRNALSACGDSARSEEAPLPTLSRRARERDQGGKAHDRELDPQELSSLCSAARAIAQEVYSARRVNSPTDRSHPLIIDGRDCGIEHGGLPVIGNSRAARLLNKDPRAFGAAVKQLYLSGSAGGVELRELLAYNESMDTDQPELDSGVASGGATPTFGRGACDAAG